MGNRDDEYYERDNRRSSQRSSRDDRYRDDRRRDMYEDDYDYDERPVRRRSSESYERSAASSRGGSRS